MSIYKRGGVYWYSFVFRGERVQRSTRQGDRKVARQMEAACRTALAKGEVGIMERKSAPTLKEFSQRFVDYVQTRSAEKPKMVEFYAQQMARLLEFEPLASARLDAIDEGLIEKFVQWRSQQGSRAGANRPPKRKAPVRPHKPISAATVNRSLATIRKLLRLDH